MRSKKPPLTPSTGDDCSVPITDVQPDDRAARLARIKLALDNGTYEISARDVAEKVIKKLRKESEKT